MPIKLPDTISESEFIQLLKATKNLKHRAAFYLGFYQCLRISEIVGSRKKLSKCHDANILTTLEKVEVDDEKKKRKIKRCSVCNNVLPHNEFKFHPTEYDIPKLHPNMIHNGQRLIKIKSAKGEKDRNIPIIKPLLLSINEFNRIAKQLPIDSDIRAIQQAFKKKITKLGMNPAYHFHTLRHSGATWLLKEKKWDIRHIQQFLGHARLETTAIYSHVSARDLLDLEWGD